MSYVLLTIIIAMIVGEDMHIFVKGWIPYDNFICQNMSGKVGGGAEAEGGGGRRRGRAYRKV